MLAFFGEGWHAVQDLIPLPLQRTVTGGRRLQLELLSLHASEQRGRECVKTQRCICAC